MATRTALALWFVFLASWGLAAAWTGRATVKAPGRERLAWFLGFALGFGLLFAGSAGVPHPSPRPAPSSILRPLWDGRLALAWVLVGVEASGFGFAWWARLHLGRLWSGMMTLREGHRVVDTGPYRWVRHPIYTGFIAAGWALALIEASAAALAGATVLTGVMSLKARAEERFLRRELGAEAYDAYAARTPRLLPFLRP